MSESVNDIYSGFTGSYVTRKASGIDQFAAKNPNFYLWAGDAEQITSRGEVAANVQLAQFTMLGMNAAGFLVAAVPVGAEPATATLLFKGPEDPEFIDPLGAGGNPNGGNTLTIGTTVIQFVVANPYPLPADAIEIGPDTGTTALNLVSYINANSATLGVTADREGAEVSLTAGAGGVAGNTIALAASGVSPVLSGPTLTGGSDAPAAPVPENKIVGVLGEAVDTTAATGTGVATFAGYWISGDFNHEALVWPPGLSTLLERRQAVAGSRINVARLP